MRTKLSLFFWRLLTASAFLMLLLPATVLAQESDFRLSVSKEFGYANGSQIRGTFSIKVVGPEEQITSVAFMIYGQPMGEVAQPPFQLKFNTQGYSTGIHELSAAVSLIDGQQLSLGPTRFDFVTAEQESRDMQRIIIPILAIVLAATVIGFGSQYLTMRGKVGNVAPGTQRNYGVLGGAICPKCKRPTPRHVWGMNMVIGKLDRCENCGKWSILRAAPIDVLRAAEQAELEFEKPAVVVTEKSEEEKLRELLDKSKYTD